MNIRTHTLEILFAAEASRSLNCAAMTPVAMTRRMDKLAWKAPRKDSPKPLSAMLTISGRRRKSFVERDDKVGTWLQKAW